MGRYVAQGFGVGDRERMGGSIPGFSRPTALIINELQAFMLPWFLPWICRGYPQKR